MTCVVLVLSTKPGSFQRSRDLLTTVQRKFSTNRKNSGERNMDDIELPMFDFNTITMATDNFSEANKLGQGGFGIVYKVSCFYGCNHNRS